MAGMIAIGIRSWLAVSEKQAIKEKSEGQGKVGIAQTRGAQEIQADMARSMESQAGIMAVLADGIGNQNTGKVCAQVVTDAILDRYESYHVLHDPGYFFKTSFYEANLRVQKTIGDRRGGASMGAVFLDHGCLTYALAGDIRIALFRRGELIPLSKGQTVDVLAVDAWQEGRIARQDALWSMEEKRIWNYVGMDGFHEVEMNEHPIRLKGGDLVFMASKGIFDGSSWGEIEDILVEGAPVQEAADRIIRAVEAKRAVDGDNGSVVVIKVRMGTL